MGKTKEFIEFIVKTKSKGLRVYCEGTLFLDFTNNSYQSIAYLNILLRSTCFERDIPPGQGNYNKLLRKQD